MLRSPLKVVLRRKTAAMKQLQLFGDINFSERADTISIGEAATTLNVSEATIRNWIKTNVLQTDHRNQIARGSLSAFRENVVGKSKLVGRANKSSFDNHDHNQLQQTVDDLLRKGNKIGLAIGDIYENGLSNSYKNCHGVYYTPAFVCDAFFANLEVETENLIFLDPCCGSGNFLLAAIKAGFRAENVYGCDLDGTALAIAKRRILELTGHQTANLFRCDFLDIQCALQSKIPTADVIFTNPPWGQKANKLEKGKLAEVFQCNKSMDTSGMFLLACQRKLSKRGYYGFLLPDSFFNVAAFEKARKTLLDDQLISIFDHGKVFAGLVTRAVSVIAKKRDSKNCVAAVSCLTLTGARFRNQTSFQGNPNSIINYWATPKEIEVIDYFFKIDHITLINRAKWALGVVTGNNKAHLKSKAELGLVHIYTGTDIETTGLKSPTKFISADLSQLQQVAPKSLYDAPAKIVYRFISSKIVCYCDTTGSLFLNSANLFIPDDEFPISNQILADYLSSDFINWVFQKVFSTHKILRSDLEKLPILVNQLDGLTIFQENYFISAIGIERTENGSYRIKGSHP
jgi:site-specific DNA-methyltransferase (adenine-specific)